MARAAGCAPQSLQVRQAGLNRRSPPGPDRTGLAAYLRLSCCARPLPHAPCHRCQDLSNGAMIPAVADFAQIAGNGMGQAAAATGFEGKRLLTPEQLRASLK